MFLTLALSCVLQCEGPNCVKHDQPGRAGWPDLSRDNNPGKSSYTFSRFVQGKQWLLDM